MPRPKASRSARFLKNLSASLDHSVDTLNVPNPDELNENVDISELGDNKLCPKLNKTIDKALSNETGDSGLAEGRNVPEDDSFSALSYIERLIAYRFLRENYLSIFEPQKPPSSTSSYYIPYNSKDFIHSFRTNSHFGFVCGSYKEPYHFHLPKHPTKYIPLKKYECIDEFFSSKEPEKVNDPTQNLGSEQVVPHYVCNDPNPFEPTNDTNYNEFHKKISNMHYELESPIMNINQTSQYDSLNKFSQIWNYIPYIDFNNDDNSSTANALLNAEKNLEIDYLFNSDASECSSKHFHDDKDATYVMNQNDADSTSKCVSNLNIETCNTLAAPDIKKDCVQGEIPNARDFPTVVEDEINYFFDNEECWEEIEDSGSEDESAKSDIVSEKNVSDEDALHFEDVDSEVSVVQSINCYSAIDSSDEDIEINDINGNNEVFSKKWFKVNMANAMGFLSAKPQSVCFYNSNLGEHVLDLISELITNGWNLARAAKIEEIESKEIDESDTTSDVNEKHNSQESQLEFEALEKETENTEIDSHSDQIKDSVKKNSRTKYMSHIPINRNFSPINRSVRFAKTDPTSLKKKLMSKYQNNDYHPKSQKRNFILENILRFSQTTEPKSISNVKKNTSTPNQYSKPIKTYMMTRNQNKGNSAFWVSFDKNGNNKNPNIASIPKSNSSSNTDFNKSVSNNQLDEELKALNKDTNDLTNCINSNFEKENQIFDGIDKIRQDFSEIVCLHEEIQEERKQMRSDAQKFHAEQLKRLENFKWSDDED